MADYKSMYTRLFNAMTSAITVLQQAQQETENLFIEAPDPVVTIIHDSKKPTDTGVANEEEL